MQKEFDKGIPIPLSLSENGREHGNGKIGIFHLFPPLPSALRPFAWDVASRHYWLNEAASETYIPVLGVFNQLVEEGHLPKVVVGISPVLAEQLAAPTFKEGLRGYLKNRIDGAREDGERFERWNLPNMKGLAEM